MGVAKFLFVSGTGEAEAARPLWPGVHQPFAGTLGPDGRWVAWRLLGGNHRELGRSPTVFADVAAARHSARSLQALIAQSRPHVRSVPTGLWTWRLLVDDVPVAASGRTYARQREAAYSVSAFVAAVPLAVVSEVVAGFRRSVPAPRSSSDNVNVRCTPNGGRADEWYTHPDLLLERPSVPDDKRLTSQEVP